MDVLLQILEIVPTLLIYNLHVTYMSLLDIYHYCVPSCYFKLFEMFSLP